MTKEIEPTDAASPPPKKGYFAFFWPLSLMGIAMLSGRLAQNFVLLQFHDGVRELALYALALALFQPMRSALGMIPQMVTFWTRDRTTARSCMAFVVIWACLLTLPVMIVAWTPLGGVAVQLIYGLKTDEAAIVATYLRYLSPVLLGQAIRQYSVGVLIRQKRTGWATVLQVLNFLVVIAVLGTGMMLEWGAVHTVGLSALLNVVVTAVVAVGLLAIFWRHLPAEEGEPIPMMKLAHYYWPLASTTFMFTLSRPIIFKFVMMLPDSVDTTAIVAALSLAFNIGMVFQITVNQFRHLLIRYVEKDAEGVKSFMIRGTVIVVAIMACCQLLGGTDWFLRVMQNSKGATHAMALDAIWVLCLAPIAIAWRNYYHGLALVNKRTTAMALGGLSRNLSIAICGAIYLSIGWLNHWTSASLLVIAFLAEGTTVALACKLLIKETVVADDED